jgi:chromosome segregation ATPase
MQRHLKIHKKKAPYGMTSDEGSSRSTMETESSTDINTEKPALQITVQNIQPAAPADMLQVSVRASDAVSSVEREEINKLQSTVNNKNRLIQTLTEQNDELKNQLRIARSAKEAAEKGLDLNERKYADMRVHNDSLRREKEALRAKDLKTKVLEIRYAEKNNDYDKLHSEFKILETEHHKLEESRNKLKLEAAQQAQQLAAIKREKDQADEEFETYWQEYASGAFPVLPLDHSQGANLDLMDDAVQFDPTSTLEEL